MSELNLKEDSEFIRVKNSLNLSDEQVKHYKGEARNILDKTYTKYKEAIESPNTGRRWFWELVQNAVDTLDDVNQKVDVILEIVRNDPDPYIKFSHNGGPFRLSEKIDDVDDFENFLNPGSGKSFNDTNKGGKFGTGFLSTHCLSPKIRVEGKVKNNEGTFHYNSVLLDRTEIIKTDELSRRVAKLKITKQLIEYQNNKEDSKKEINNVSASFTYLDPLNLEKLSEGIKEIYYSIPYVFAFNPQLNSITISNEGDQHIYTNNQSPLVNNGLKIFQSSYKNEENETMFYVAVLKGEKTEIAWRVELDNSRWFFSNFATEYKEDFKDDYSSLFCRYPLIGSASFKFPVIVNSVKFRPEEKRNGINLIEEDNTNKSLIEEALKLFEQFLINIKEFKAQYNIADIFIIGGTNSLPAWIDKEWYKNIVVKLKELLLNNIQLAISDHESINLRESKIPFLPKNDFDKDVRMNFYNLCKQLFPADVPASHEYNYWYNQLDLQSFSSIKFDLKKLIEFIENDIQSLSNLKSYVNDPINWQKKFLRLISDFDNKLFDHHKVIPNQIGEFKSRTESIFINNDIELEDKSNNRNILLEIYYQIFKSDFEAILLHRDFHDIPNILKEERNRDTKSLIKEIDDGISEIENTEDKDFRKTLQYLFNWLDQNEDEELYKEFKYLNEHQSDLYFKSFTDVDRDLSLSLMQTYDHNSLTALSNAGFNETEVACFVELKDTGVNFEDLSELSQLSGKAGIEEAKKTLKEIVNEKEEKLFKKELGEKIEIILNNLFEREFKEFKAEVKPVNEYDIVIFNERSPEKKFYIELKSLNVDNPEPVKMGIHQAKFASKCPERYALIYISKQRGIEITEEYLKANIICDLKIGINVQPEVEKSLAIDEIKASHNEFRLSIKDPSMKVHIRKNHFFQLKDGFSELQNKINELLK